MKVYIIQSGCKYEGGGAESVHKTRDGAFRAIENTLNEKNFKEIYEDYWENEYEYICISEREVLE